MPAAKKTAPESSLADLFGEVEMESTRAKTTRPKVDVPEGVLKVLKEAQASALRPVWPIEQGNYLQFDSMRDVFASASDLIGATILAAPGIKEDGQFIRVKDDPANFKATHVRVTVGKRRGPRKSADETGDQSGE